MSDADDWMMLAGRPVIAILENIDEPIIGFVSQKKPSPGMIEILDYVDMQTKLTFASRAMVYTPQRFEAIFKIDTVDLLCLLGRRKHEFEFTDHSNYSQPKIACALEVNGFNKKYAEYKSSGDAE